MKVFFAYVETYGLKHEGEEIHAFGKSKEQALKTLQKRFHKAYPKGHSGMKEYEGVKALKPSIQLIDEWFSIQVYSEDL